MKEKSYLIEVRESKQYPKIFILEFEQRKNLRTYIEVNWGLKKYRVRVFELKKVIIDTMLKPKRSQKTDSEEKHGN